MTTVDTSSRLHEQPSVNHLRLVWALASKDIADALKTKATLMTIIVSLAMVAFYRVFPALTLGGDTLNVMLYAESESALVTELERSPALAVYTYDSREHLMRGFAGAETLVPWRVLHVSARQGVEDVFEQVRSAVSHVL